VVAQAVSAAARMIHSFGPSFRAGIRPVRHKSRTFDGFIPHSAPNVAGVRIATGLKGTVGSPEWWCGFGAGLPHTLQQSTQ
jgi:hypothetical protein